MSRGRVVLHVGAMKSGTTYLQTRLFANRSTLADRGVFLPGKQWRTQSRAVWGLLNGEGRQWAKMARRMSAHPGLSVVSMEFLAAAPLETARAVRDSVDADVEVVITARDLNRSIPAMWQESVRNGRTWTYEHYVAALRANRPGLCEQRQGSRAGRHFWRQQDLVSIARTWAEAVGHERVTVVSVPHPGASRDLLWERFTSVLGIDAEGLVPVSSGYESLGAASAQVMRRFNELFEANDLTFAQSQVARKVVLASEVLGPHKADEPAIGLEVAPWVVEESAAVVEGLRSLDVALAGSWDDLVPVDVPGIDPGDVDDAEVAEAAVFGLAGFLEAVVRDRGVLER